MGSHENGSEQFCREKQTLKYDDIQDLILSEEVRMGDKNIDNAQDQAFVTENKSRDRSRGPNDRNSMVGHNQEIDFSSRKLENASIVGKRVT